jgi:hypothetical protein
MSAENYDLKPCPKSSEPRRGWMRGSVSALLPIKLILTKGPVSPSSSLFLARLTLTTLFVGVPGLAFAQNVQSDGGEEGAKSCFVDAAAWYA